MTFVNYQVISYDITDVKLFAEYKEWYFSTWSVSMKTIAEKVGAQAFYDQGESIVGGQMFDTLTCIIQAPNRPQLTSTLLIGAINDKAVAFNSSCTGPDCLSADKAIRTAKFANLSKDSSQWNFKIPYGWTEVALTSADEKMSIKKGEENTLVFSLLEDESQEIETLSMAEIKMSLFNDSLTTFRSIAEESGLSLISDEEEVLLGKQTFNVLSIGLVPPGQEEPVYVVSQMISIVDKKLAMILVTCVDEQSCNEIQQAVGESTF